MLSMMNTKSIYHQIKEICVINTLKIKIKKKKKKKVKDHPSYFNIPDVDQIVLDNK